MNDELNKVKRKIKLRKIFENKPRKYKAKHRKFTLLTKNNTEYEGMHFEKYQGKHFSKSIAEMEDEPAFSKIKTGRIEGTEDVIWKNNDLSEEALAANIFLPVPNDFEREFPILSKMFPRLSISKMGKRLLSFKMKFRRKGKNNNIEEKLIESKELNEEKKQQAYKENFKYDVQENANKNQTDKAEEKMAQERNSNEKEKDEER